MRKNPLLKILRITDVNKVFGEITKYVDVIKFHTKWAGTILGGTSLRLPASNSALASREARRRIVPGSPQSRKLGLVLHINSIRKTFAYIYFEYLQFPLG